jgi:uncharacterized protein with beta-barrel porin domain
MAGADQRRSGRVARVLRGIFLPAVLAGLLAAGQLVFNATAFAACTPVTGIGTPSNASVTCSASTINQNTLAGYGTGVQNNDIVDVLANASVTGTNQGLVLGDGNTVNVATGATVSGGFTGAQFGAGTTTLNNSNMIAGNGNNAVVNGVSSSGGTLVVNNTGAISGTSTAVLGAAVGVNANGDVIVAGNSGSITANGNGLSAVGLQGANVIITSNAGNITAIDNGFLAVGVEASNNVTIVSNTGTISATGTNSVATIGVLTSGSLTVTSNTGLISGTSAGITLSSLAVSGNITNGVGGSIEGTAAGTSVGISSAAAPITVTNLGMISGGLAGIRASSGSISNDAGGVITGAAGVSFRPGNVASSIFNAGTITGTGGTAILFSTGSVGNTLTVAPGFAITGNVVGAGADVFQLGGAGNATFNLSSLGASQQYQGFSTFNKIDSSIWTVTGTGNQPWTVTGGTFLVDGSIAGVVNVTAGTLGGTGAVGTTTVGAGATLSPGHAGLGTLSINGNLTLSGSSSYLIGVSGASVGLTAVSGSASLNGTATAVFQGTPSLSRYAIISTSAGRTGTFSSFVPLDLPFFLSAGLAYTPTEVDLTLNSSLGLIAGLTPNQAAVGAALDRAFNAGNGLLSALAAVTPNQLPAVLTALSGEGTSGTQETALGAADLFMDLLMQRGASWRSGGTADAFGAVTGARSSYAREAASHPSFKAVPAPAPLDGPRYRTWAAGFGGAWSLGGEANPGSANLTHSTAGGAAGVDYLVNPGLLIGLAAGGNSSSFSVPDRATSGTIDGAHLGGYGVVLHGPWYTAGTLAFSTFDNRTNRTVVTGAGPAEIETGSFRSEALSGRFEVGYQQRFDRFTVTPFAAVQFAELWQGGYTEASATVAGAPGALGLSYASRSTASLPTFLGGQLDGDFALPNGMLWSPQLRASWVHEFEPTRSISASFIALPAGAFTVDGPRAAMDSARVDFGSKLLIARNVVAFAKFDGEFADRSQMYAGQGGLEVTW